MYSIRMIFGIRRHLKHENTAVNFNGNRLMLRYSLHILVPYDFKIEPLQLSSWLVWFSSHQYQYKSLLFAGSSTKYGDVWCRKVILWLTFLLTLLVFNVLYTYFKSDLRWSWYVDFGFFNTIEELLLGFPNADSELWKIGKFTILFPLLPNNSN